MPKRLEIIKKRRLDKSQKELILLRKKIGMSQKNLAAEFFVTPGAIACWELGINPIPGPVKKLVQIYLRAAEADYLTSILRGKQ